MIENVKAVLSAVGIVVAILLVLFVIAIFVDPVTEGELCSDHGGRWNSELNACECERDELSDPRVSKERTLYCNTPLVPSETQIRR